MYVYYAVLLSLCGLLRLYLLRCLNVVCSACIVSRHSALLDTFLSCHSSTAMSMKSFLEGRCLGCFLFMQCDPLSNIFKFEHDCLLNS